LPVFKSEIIERVLDEEKREKKIFCNDTWHLSIWTDDTSYLWIEEKMKKTEFLITRFNIYIYIYSSSQSINIWTTVSRVLFSKSTIDPRRLVKHKKRTISWNKEKEEEEEEKDKVAVFALA